MKNSDELLEKFVNQISKKSDEFFEREFYASDGNSAERIAKIIKKLLLS